METYTIHPEYDKIKGLSPLWINEYESIDILKTDYDQIVRFIQEVKIKDIVDNICFIFLLLQEGSKSFDLNNELTNYDTILNEDLKQVIKYLKIRDEYQNCTIYKIDFLVMEDQKIKPVKDGSSFLKKESFYIQNPGIIAKTLKNIFVIHGIGFPEKENYEGILKRLKPTNKQTALRKKLAHNLYKYLQHSGMDENNKYYSIGFLFQLSGLENKLSESDYLYIANQPDKTSSYKSYADFVTINIRRKYFKCHEKIK